MTARASMDFQQPRRLRFWGAQGTSAHQLVATVVLVMGAISVIFATIRNWEAIERERELHEQVLLLSREVELLTPTKAVARNPVAPQDARRQSRIIHQLNLPWADVLQALEQRQPQGVALVSMEPAGAGSLRLQTESLSLDLLLAHAASLQSTGPFGFLIYTRHETHERDPNLPVRLSFEIGLQGHMKP